MKVREVDLEVHEWEDQVKAIKETQEHISNERGRDGEMEGMKSEVGIQVLGWITSWPAGALPRPEDEGPGEADRGADRLPGGACGGESLTSTNSCRSGERQSMNG